MNNLKNRERKLKQIEKEVIALNSSPLCCERILSGSKPVIGEGSVMSEIMFIGEAPGKKEALTGRPFCGSAGRVLDELLSYINISRDDVYITNIVKDRPENNRDPSPEEIVMYAPFLDRQIEIIQPRIIVTLGRFSMDYILKRFCNEISIPSIGEAHGRKYITKLSYGEVVIVPLYHPAASIYNQKLKKTLLRDIKILKKM